MPDSHSIKNDFLRKASEIIEENISNDQFGVSELASEMGMSRSNLLRKIRKHSELSASQFIRQVRLNRAMELLKDQSYTVSEVTYKVGFNSTSYFIKCFREHYGYPPGEAGRRGAEKSGHDEQITHSHQLAAIMFTDIQGYTTLMQQDEVKAVGLRNRHREVFNAETEKFKGKILQYYGDGTLSTFNSAIDAVKCGIELQLAFQQEPRVPVRIGIHSGDIIFTEDDIIGDGVNVANRIESMASVGSVLVSEKVYDEVKNQTDIQTTSLGVFQLKNVDRPMEVFAISNTGLDIPQGEQLNGRISRKSGKWFMAKWLIILLAVIGIGYLLHSYEVFVGTGQLFITSEQSIDKKSIAVLPFINDSDDSTNIYIINGLMESILNNLQSIEDLRVISRTSVEKYRNNPKTIKEIAKDLNVNYIVEGSGQKIGDQIFLNIQLIETSTDKHLWAAQYKREAKDIFQLQMEVAKSIAGEIEVIIKPEEEKRINKIPTDDLVAYDYFLKGIDLFYKGTPEGLEEAVSYFKKAIEHDNEFARAYADVAIAYFFLDVRQTEKMYSDQINYYADQALLFDPHLPQSLIAKALFYMYNGEYELAVPYLEKALEYNPNSALVINTLSDFYTSYIPNTEKYLEYALKGIQLDIAAQDSFTASYTFLHISNAFIQTGFIDEAEKYINKSIMYNPDNLYSEYVKAYILYARDRNLGQLNELLLIALEKDSTRLDIVQEVGKSYYYLRYYKSAYAYYAKFNEAREVYNLDIYKGENAKIGLVLAEVGLKEESDKYFADFLNYAENDNSIYKHVSLAAYYSSHGDADKALEHFKLFSREDNYHFWVVIFIGIDPLFDHIKDHPEFNKILEDIENKFREDHDQIKDALEEEGLL